MTRLCCLAAALVAAGCCPSPAAKPAVVVPPVAAAVAPPPAPAFDPPLPTLRLPRNFTPTKYTARLQVDPASPDFSGHIAIDGALDQRSAVIWLDAKDLHVQRASANSGDQHVELAATPHGDYLELRPAAPLDAGAWTLDLTYTGQVTQNGFRGAFVTKYGDDPYLATQFESLGARLVFPCVDEPDRKTPWQLTLDVPASLVAVSNTSITGTTAGADNTHVSVQFDVTKPLPSYLVAFAVGPWQVIDAGKAKSGLPIRIVGPRGTTDKLQALALVEPKIVDFLEDWFGIPFPYPKLDVVALPSRAGGAMENAGMITTDARIVMFAHPSAHEQYLMTSVIGHETAHQWFGDLVTAAWWDDIWLNESFATWMEDKVVAALEPGVPSEVHHDRTVLKLDTLDSARKIRQPIEGEGDIDNAFDAITYPKGALVLRMIEHQVGEPVFQAAIRDYLNAHAYGSARAADVFAAIEKQSSTSLTAETASFFDQPGAPLISLAATCTGNAATIAVAQHRLTASVDDKLPDEAWTVPICVAYDDGKGGRGQSCTLLAQPTAELPIDHCPKWIAPSGTYTYGRFALDDKALAQVRDVAWPKLTVDERIAIYDDAWDAARAGRLPIAVAMSVATKLRAGSPEELAVALGDSTGIGNNGGNGLPPGLAPLLSDQLRSAAEAYVRRIVEPLARQRGLVARADEDVAQEAARAAVLGAIIWSHSHVLDAEAKRVVEHFRDLPRASRVATLIIAANADANVADKLLAEAFAEHDPELHGELLATVFSIDDAKHHRAMLDKVVPDPKLTAPDLLTVLTVGDTRTLADSQAYVREHIAELLARLPVTSTSHLAVRLLRVFTGACDPAKRDDTAAFITEHFGSVVGGARPAKQAIEAYDHCVTARHLIEPAVRTWLGVK